MKVEAPDIQRSALKRLLEAEYGLSIADLTFVPVGEESYSYRATTHSGANYFVKVHDALPGKPGGLPASGAPLANRVQAHVRRSGALNPERAFALRVWPVCDSGL